MQRMEGGEGTMVAAARIAGQRREQGGRRVEAVGKEVERPPGLAQGPGVLCPWMEMRTGNWREHRRKREEEERQQTAGGGWIG